MRGYNPKEASGRPGVPRIGPSPVSFSTWVTLSQLLSSVAAELTQNSIAGIYFVICALTSAKVSTSAWRCPRR